MYEIVVPSVSSIGAPPWVTYEPLPTTSVEAYKVPVGSEVRILDSDGNVLETVTEGNYVVKTGVATATGVDGPTFEAQHRPQP